MKKEYAGRSSRRDSYVYRIFDVTKEVKDNGS